MWHADKSGDARAEQMGDRAIRGLAHEEGVEDSNNSLTIRIRC